MASGSRITDDVVSAIASLQSRHGSRYTDIIKTLRSNGVEPSFIQIKSALMKASEDGVVNKTSRGLWQLGSANKNSTDSTVLQRRRGRRSRTQGKHSRRRRSRRRGRGRGRKARKVRGRGRKARKVRGRGRKARKGRGRKEREERKTRGSRKRRRSRSRSRRH